MYVVNGSDGRCIVAVRLIVGVHYLERPLREVLLCIYIYIYLYRTTFLVPRGPPVTRKRRTGRLRFNGQHNRLENGYFSSKPWLEIGSSYEAADLPTYL